MTDQTDLKNALDNKANINDIPDTSNFLSKNGLLATLGSHEDNTITQKGITDAINLKQDKLVSGTNIKTINNQSIVGNGNIDIPSGGIEYEMTLSSTEHEVGFDYVTNKTIYEKSFHLDSLAQNTPAYFNIGTISKLVNITGQVHRVYNNQHYYFPVNFSNGANTQTIQTFIIDNQLFIQSYWPTLTGGSVDINVYYEK